MALRDVDYEAALEGHDMAVVTLTESDLMYLLTLLRSSDTPLTTDEFVAALRTRAGIA